MKGCSIAVKIVLLRVLPLYQQEHTQATENGKVPFIQKGAGVGARAGIQGNSPVPASATNMFLDLSQIVPYCLESPICEIGVITLRHLGKENVRV